MSDARWFEVEKDLASAQDHFGNSVDLYRLGGFGGDDLDAYRARMAFMHAMQCGHTSLENALLRILTLLREEPPDGPEWHADLLARTASPLGSRPAILPRDLQAAADLTRRFRHVATRSYQNFREDLAKPAVEAASTLAQHLPAAISAFRRVIDPD